MNKPEAKHELEIKRNSRRRSVGSIPGPTLPKTELGIDILSKDDSIVRKRTTKSILLEEASKQQEQKEEKVEAKKAVDRNLEREKRRYE